MNKKQEQQILDYYSTTDKYIRSRTHSNVHQTVFTKENDKYQWLVLEQKSQCEVEVRQTDNHGTITARDTYELTRNLCKKRKVWDRALWKDAAVPSLIPSASIVFPENPILFQRPGVGRAHGKEQPRCFIFGAKNQTFLYKTMGIGNTIIRKINRHQIHANNSTEYGTYLNLIGRIFPP